MSIKVFYYFAKINGLVPFQLSLRRKTATPSTQSFVYSLITITMLILFFFVSQYSVTKTATSHMEKFTSKLVFAFQVIISCTYFFYIFVRQIVNYKIYIYLINESFSIRRLICNRYKVNNFYEHAIYSAYNSKVISLIVQVICATFPTYGFILTYNEDIITVLFPMVPYGHILILSFGYIYYITLLFVFQCYRIINENLLRQLKCLMEISESGRKQMKMQEYCNLSDELDEISKLYDKTTDFLSVALKLHSKTVILTVLESFVIVLSQVLYTQN